MFLGPKRLLKTQSFEEKGNLSCEEKFSAYFFSHSIEYDNYHGTIFKGPEGNLASIVQAI